MSRIIFVISKERQRYVPNYPCHFEGAPALCPELSLSFRRSASD